jgi:hypothetical protein
MSRFDQILANSIKPFFLGWATHDQRLLCSHLGGNCIGENLAETLGRVNIDYWSKKRSVST